MRDIEELRAIANKRNQTLETLLYDMLVDAMTENQKNKEVIDKADDFIKEYRKNRNMFKRSEQDYIDVIDEIDSILKEVE